LKQRYFEAISILVFLVTCLSGCRTVNLEPGIDRNEGTPGEAGVSDKKEYEEEREKALVKTEREYVFIEKPVYVPLQENSRHTTTGVASVQDSNAEGTIAPEDYTHASRLYDYDPNQVYEIYTQVLRLTDIYLEPGELSLDDPFISDSDRWVIGAGVSQENGVLIQHIYIKPKAAGLEATMIINTDRRVYHLLLRSYTAVYMPIVRFRYYDSIIRKTYISPDVLPNTAERPLEQDSTGQLEYIDPRYLSFNYTARYGLFRRRPVWMPNRVYDDGKKTYIVFPEAVLQREMPGIFENKNDIVNYRVLENIVIIDKLIEKITIQYQNRSVTIEKKKG
jgi:type IV secretion system protein VirB9